MSQTKAQLIDPVDGTIVNADINASAAIAGTKVAPDFGSQNIVTTGTLSLAAVAGTNTNASLNVLFQTSAGVIDGGSGLTYNPATDALSVNGNFINSTTFRGSGALGRLTCASHSSSTFIDVSNTIDIATEDNATDAFTLKQGSNEYITVDTNNSSEFITLGNTTTNPKTAILGGNVGIGTSSPTSKLNVAGRLDVDGLQNQNTCEFFANQTSGQSFGILVNGGTTSGDYCANFRDKDAGAIMILRGNGNVGIGTSSPGKKLDINGEMRADAFIGRTNISTAPSEDTAIYRAADNQLAFSTASTERLRIDNTGKVGIGTGADVRGQLQIGSGNGGGNIPSNDELVFGANNSVISFLSANDNASVDGVIGAWNTVYNHQNSKIVFDKNAGNVGQILFFTQNGSGIAEYMRLTNSGSLFINTTSAISAGVAGAEFHQGNNAELRCGTTGTGNSTQIRFYNANGEVGAIRTNGSATVYHTSSDYRRKENAVAISDGIKRLKTLKPYRFNFKADSSTILDGFFAHEVSSVVPEAISGTKDEVVTQAHVDSGEKKESELGDPIYQGIDQSKLVPLLVAAVKELITKVETLEAA